MIPHHGYLEIIHGPMMSSKTTTLISVIQKLCVLGRSVLVLNHELDTRSDLDVIRTHDGRHLPAKKVRSLVQDVSQEDLGKFDAIAVDEAQFFNDLDTAVRSWLALEKFVVIAGLISDVRQEQFGHILPLFLVADEIRSLTAYCNVCNDGTPAPFTALRPGESAGVGGTEKYLAVCRKHLSS